MLKKNIFASLYPLEKIQEPDVINQPEKPRFSVPENVYTPVQMPENGDQIPQEVQTAAQTEPTFANGSPMIRNAENVFAPQSTQPIVNEPSFNANDISYLKKSTDETPLQKAEKERNAELEWQKKPVNQDKGWKGAIFEGIQNFLHSMGESYRMNPRANWQQILAGGAIGTGLGYVDRTWNDRRNHERKLAEAQRNYELQLNSEKNNSTLANAQANRDYKYAQGKAAILNQLNNQQKIQFEQLDKSKQEILKVWGDLDEFNPNDPVNKNFVERAKLLNIELLPKTKGEKFTFQVAPDGRVIIGNTKTGEIKTGEGNYAKPLQISDNDLPDELFGLYSEKDISDKATASVGQLPPERKIKEDVRQMLLNEKSADGTYRYRKDDGTLDENKYLSDRNAGYSKLDLYENLPSDYEQKVAGARQKLRESQQSLRSEVARFRSALKNSKPSDMAQAQPLTKVVDLFNAIMQLPPKVRSEKLKIFYENLHNIRVQ